MNLTAEKKENLYRNVSRSLEPEFKEPRELEGQNVSENTSAFSSVENSFLYKQLVIFRNYHTEFASVVDELLKHFEHPEFGAEIYKDFEESLEWREIAVFCTTLAELIEPVVALKNQTEKMDSALANFTTLQAIKEDLNLRQAADTFRKCMMILKNDNMFRQMAHKFSVSPRQNQRIRERMEDWPKKDAKAVIEKVLTSLQCASCKNNILTGRKPLNPLDENFKNYRLSDYGLPDHLKIPNQFKVEMKTKNYTPIEIAEKVFAKKLRMAPIITT